MKEPSKHFRNTVNILAALERRHANLAEAAIKAHIQSARENILNDIYFKD
ncbi:MAG: hypothetical protein ACYC64_09950 [Armatimonadota bacterium]